MNQRIGPTNNLCYICRRPLEQPARGRMRLTCSDACRQARRRFMQGKRSRRWHQRGKAIQERQWLPFMERRFDKRSLSPVIMLSQKRWAYECFACGRTYIVERIRSGAPASAYCSDRCEQKSIYSWKRFDAAFAKANRAGIPIDNRVWERLFDKKLSPLCPHCGKPFAPNTTPEGKRLRGRPRRYCSDFCRKAAYERRWKTQYGRARVHRFHHCVECGEKFDRTDTMGRRQKRFCTDRCRRHFEDRVKAVRQKLRARGITRFKWGATGQRLAARNAPKNKAKPFDCDTGEVFSTGGLKFGGRLQAHRDERQG